MVRGRQGLNTAEQPRSGELPKPGGVQADAGQIVCGSAMLSSSEIGHWRLVCIQLLTAGPPGHLMCGFPSRPLGHPLRASGGCPTGPLGKGTVLGRAQKTLSARFPLSP